MRALHAPAFLPRAATATRSFYSGLDEKRCQRLRKASLLRNPPRGRDTLSRRFEQSIHIVPLVSLDDMVRQAAATPNSAIVEPLALGEVDQPAVLPSPFPWRYSSGLQPAAVRRALRKNSDTDAYTVSKEAIHPEAKHSVLVIPVVDPDLTLEHALGGREEAQVELITAYRNILYEAVEAKGPPIAVLKIPVLALFSAGGSCASQGLYASELPKLTQEALIKGFHRIPNAAKEQLMWRSRNSGGSSSSSGSESSSTRGDVPGPGDLRVELHVPVPLLTRYTQTFLTEAWATPSSLVIPKRFSLYPALAPPERLLEMPGWVGHRPELVEAVRTKGASLLTGDVLLLDGTVAELGVDVPSTQTVYEDRAGKAAALAREQQTAEAQGFVRQEAKPLHEGLLND